MTTSLLRITDGTVTKTFTSGDNMKLLTYEPKASNDGEAVKESAQVDFVSTASTNTTNIRLLNRLFEQARNYQRTKTGPEVYIEFDPGTSGTTYRSPLVDGKVRLPSDILGPWKYDTRFHGVEIEWTRAPYWEGPLTAVPLTNDSATDDTSGIAISNRDDGGTAQVETATVVGTITGAGNATFTLTAAGMTGSPIATSVAVLVDDTASDVATKAATAMNLDSDITDLFNIAASGADVVVTRLVAAANDATLNLAFTNDTCTGLTPDATSADTTAGSATVNENWVTIGASDVDGDLPSAIKLELYNTKSGATATDEINIFHNVWSTPASWPHVIEGEDGTGGTVTAVADATCSGGFRADLTYTATTETLIGTWAISATNVDYMKGGQFKIYARWAADFPYANMYIRAKIVDGNVVKHEGRLRWIPTTRQLHELDTFDAPRNKNGTLTMRSVDLKLYALRNEAGAHTINLDYLEVVPIATGWKRFKTDGAGVAYQEYFTHDATENITYKTDTATKDGQDFSDYGPDILLVPNQAQKIYITTCDSDGDAHVEQTWTMKLWYRPRRSAL